MRDQQMVSPIIIFNFVNLMRSCHLVLVNKRKCDDDDDDSLLLDRISVSSVLRATVRTLKPKKT